MEFGKTPENDLTGRRRLSVEAMLARDEQVAALRGQGTSLRQIGARLGMSLASVQLAVRRIQKRGVPEGPNLLELYRALRGLSGPEQRAALEEFRVAADGSESNSPNGEDRGYL
jgi:DNA-binding CsgD family transcriptional regulator